MYMYMCMISAGFEALCGHSCSGWSLLVLQITHYIHIYIYIYIEIDRYMYIIYIYIYRDR